MAIGIVSLIADGRVRLKVYCGSAACLSRAVDKSYLSVKQSSFQGRVRLKVYCGSAACLSRAVDKSYLSVKQSSFQWLKLKNSSSGSY